MNNFEQKAGELFSHAIELDSPEERASYLDEACGGDVALRQRVEALLQASERAEGFLVIDKADERVAEGPGSVIDRYKLLEEIGEGGFGVVFMAEQLEPIRRRVALKIVKPGMDTRQVIARFEAERQALALMEHPNIAQVFDAGATESGRPYFVMELVHGVPITQYCDDNTLTPEERLKLFIPVCEAVQHAHLKGIIHRDLKPTNILVTLHDGKPVPKVIDFGTAKALQQSLTEKTMFTAYGKLIGTPQYMSPEQAEMSGLDVDTRADIYSLGVLLYELLTGTTPFAIETLRVVAFDEMMRMIREDDPPKPSTRISTLGVRATDIASHRHADPKQLRNSMQGDLDWIVMKALEKERKQRYESVLAMGQDLQRHLEHRPVLAGPPSMLYRLGKSLRRNRTRLVMAAATAVILVLAVVGIKYRMDSTQIQGDLHASGESTVISAARADDVRMLRRLLDGNPELVNLRDEDGAGPLWHAAATGSTNALKLLLERGAEVDELSNNEFTSLSSACIRGDAATAALLLSAGADPGQSEYLLSFALFSGSAEVGRMLLARGVDPDVVVTSDRVTALHFAATLGHDEFVELLLEHGANPDVKSRINTTPLHHAAGALSGDRYAALMEKKVDSLSGNEDKSDDTWRNLIASSVGDQIDFFKAASDHGGDHLHVAELLINSGADIDALDFEKQTPLHYAAAHNNHAVVELLIQKDADVNATSDKDCTPLNLAAFGGHEAVIRLLLEAGADPNLVDDEGFTPLNTAIEHRHKTLVPLLLAHHANPNIACKKGGAPLQIAAARCDIETMELLIDAGASVHASDTATALATAAARGDLPAVRFLLDRGAQPNMGSSKNDMNALHWAAQFGHPSVVETLLGRGANINAQARMGTPLHAVAIGRDGARRMAERFTGDRPFEWVIGSHDDYAEVMRMLLAADPDLNLRNRAYGRTALCVAVIEGNVSAIDALLEAGADVNAAEREGFTPLHKAANIAEPDTMMSNIVIRLIKAGAGIEARDGFGGTPLHCAAESGHTEMVRLLLEAGADIDSIGPNGFTPLKIAVGKRHSTVVNLLLKAGADTEMRKAKGYTALHLAAQLGYIEIAGMLLSAGADPNAVFDENITPLHCATENGHIQIVRLLLDAGADIDNTGPNKFTALKLAVVKRNSALVQLLLEAGADPKVRKENDSTALHEAAYRGDAEIVEMLLSAGADPNAVFADGFTPLMSAARAGFLDIVKLLLTNHADLTQRKTTGSTVLHLAADNGQADVVKYLLKLGMDPDGADKVGSSPMHLAGNGYFAEEDRYIEVIQVLLKDEADINARQNNLQTPLHRAAYWGRPKIAQALIDAGANVSIRDLSGDTPLDIARDSNDPKLDRKVAAGRKECVDLLRKAMENDAPVGH